MPGILGLFAPRGLPTGRDAARRVADAMCRRPWHAPSVHEILPGRLYLGTVAHADKPAAPRAFFHREGPVACALAGWIWNVSAACGARDRVAAGDLAAAAVAAYAELGPDFVERLEGHFSLLLADTRTGRLLVGNDRQGMEPLYLRDGPDWTLLASELGPMSAGGLFRPELDRGGATEFLTYGQVLGDRTLVKESHPLPPATIQVRPLDGGPAESREYWSFADMGPKREGTPWRRQVDEVCDALVAADERIMSRPATYLCGLSGGLDSRIVAAMACRSGKPREAWTFGEPDAPDMVIAAQVAQALGLAHVTFPPDPETVAGFADQFVDAVDGACTLLYAFGAARREDLRGRADVVLNGFAGEVLLGDYLVGPKIKNVRARARWRTGRGPYVPHHLLERNRSDRDLALYMAGYYGKKSRLAPLLADAAPELAELIEADMSGPMADLAPEFKVEQWTMRNRAIRWTVTGLRGDRDYYDDASHFYEYDFYDRCLTTPARFRRGRRLYVAVMRRLAPGVAGLTYSETGLPADAPVWRVALGKGLDAARRVLGRPPAVAASSMGARPASWPGTVQKDFYRDLILDPRTLDRPIWRGDALRRLAEDHFAGVEDAGGELGLVGSVELFARRWIDRYSGGA